MEDRVITFIITQDCQLACKYCYCIGKNNAHTMNFSTIRRAIDISLDYLINDNYHGRVIFDFIGGEPLLEINIIQDAARYIRSIMSSDGFKDRFSYNLRICTNGLLYGLPSVQSFIREFKENLNITISIDGDKNKNDKNRIFKNGEGSFDAIIDNVRLWLTQFPDALTRITISSEDLPYIEESVRYLYELGLARFDISVIVEDVWKNGDDKILEEQLIRLADYILENKLDDSIYISAFEYNIGHKQTLGESAMPCGGMLVAVDSEGLIYNCLRFSKFALKNAKPRIIGDIENGIDNNKMRPLLSMDYYSIYPPQCKDCEVATGCKICPADCYDNSSTSTVFQRTVAVCKMHKAKVRAKNYYWNKYKIIHQ